MATKTFQPNVIPNAVDSRPQLRQRRLLYELIETILLIGAIYALVNLATARFIVEGSSMQPNFQTGQFIIVSRINYLFGNPEYGDIIVFHYPNDPEDDYIKRVIGLPGDTVSIRDTQVYVNNIALEEKYILEACRESQCADNTWELNEDEYFVMGDNRNGSLDSRRFGPVERKFVVGEALVRYWPPSEWDFVEQFRLYE